VSEPLEAWIEREYLHAGAAMLASVSPVGIRKVRPGFGQQIVPKRGAIVASPVLAAYDPDPDYFFHWYRDSAIVVEALRLLFADGQHERLADFADFVGFSLSLHELDGRELAASSVWRERIHAEFSRFVRSDAELAAVHGDAILAETRLNADATLDISSWPRPQHDGPALRALAVVRWTRSAALDRALATAAAQLIELDLRYTSRHWCTPCFDIWEEEKGLHYYTLCVSAAALAEGAAWSEARGEPETARAHRAQALAIRAQLDRYWLAERGYYRSRVLESGEPSAKELDISVVLAALHAGRTDAAHAPADPRVHATLHALERLFDAEYPINRDRPAGRGVALGRYAGDVYYSGGAYYFATLAAAELCYRAAAERAPAAAERRALTERGDAFLETVRAYTPQSGDLSEQFDRHTGAQSSARHLAWSYAAFVTCRAARRVAVGRATTPAAN